MKSVFLDFYYDIYFYIYLKNYVLRALQITIQLILKMILEGITIIIITSQMKTLKPRSLSNLPKIGHI